MVRALTYVADCMLLNLNKLIFMLIFKKNSQLKKNIYKYKIISVRVDWTSHIQLHVEKSF